MSQENLIDNVEYRELDLSNLEDLEVFLESAEDVYADVFEYEQVAKSEEYKSLKYEGTSGQKIFETVNQKFAVLQGLISTAHQAIVTDSGVFEDGQIDNMQQLYNDLINLRNLVRDTYEDFESVPVVEEVKVTDEPVRLNVKSTENTNATTNPEEVIVEPKSKEVTKPIEVEEAPVPVTAEQDLDPFTNIEETIKSIVGKVTKIHKQASGLFSPTEVTEEISIDLAELDVCVKRIEDLKERVEASKNANEEEVVLKNNLNRYKRVAGEIEKNAQSVLEVLLQKHTQASAEEQKSKNNKPPEPNRITPTEVKSAAKQVAGSEEDAAEFQESPKAEEPDKLVELTPEVRRRTMTIEPDIETKDEGNISIRVARKVEEALEKIPDKPREPAVSQVEIATAKPPVPVVGESKRVGQANQADKILDEVTIMAELEDQDVINEVVPDTVPSIVHPQLVHEETSLQREYINDKQYLDFIRTFHTSPAAYERILDSFVAQTEAKTIDALERFFGESYNSPFEFLQDMSVAEVTALAAKSDIRAELQENNIKYETFLTWIDLIDDMQSVVGDNPNMNFGELYARWMIETEMAYYSEQEVKNSQFTG